MRSNVEFQKVKYAEINSQREPKRARQRMCSIPKKRLPRFALRHAVRTCYAVCADFFSGLEPRFHCFLRFLSKLDIRPMKKILLAATFCFINIVASSQNIGDKIYRKIEINGAVSRKKLEVTYIAEYNENGNLIHSKDESGYERFYNYDSKGNLLYQKDTEGNESCYEYDEHGNVIHYKINHGYEYWNEYDSKGHKISYKDSNGQEDLYEYDSSYKKVHVKNNNSNESWYEYDDNGNEIYFRNSRCERWQKYDSNGKRIYFKTSLGEESWYEYDDNGNLVHYKNESGYENWIDYDNKGNKIHSKNTFGSESWYEYTFWENGKVKRLIACKSIKEQKAARKNLILRRLKLFFGIPLHDTFIDSKSEKH